MIKYTYLFLFNVSGKDINKQETKKYWISTESTGEKSKITVFPLTIQTHLASMHGINMIAPSLNYQQLN